MHFPKQKYVLSLKPPSVRKHFEQMLYSIFVTHSRPLNKVLNCKLLAKKYIINRQIISDACTAMLS